MIGHVWGLVLLLIWATNTLAERSMRGRQLVINGDIAEEGRYPYFVSIERYCGGALIAPDIVLAAGHCRNTHGKVRARVGTYSFKHLDGSVLLDVEQQIRHPNWEQRSDDDDYFVHDFLLLKLNQTVYKNRDGADIPILRMNRDNRVPRHMQSVVAMGVGNTDPGDGDSRSSTLRRVELSAISGEACNTYQDPDRDITYQGRIENCHLCTRGGEAPNTKDTCSYDSGSPIILPGTSAAEDLLVGLVSWGEDCADDVFPAVNARVSDSYDWIRANVCIISRDPPAYLCGYVIEPPDAPATQANASPTAVWLLLALLVVATAAVIWRMLLPKDKPPRRFISFSKLSIEACTPETQSLSARTMHHRNSSYDSVGVSMM